jgi:hypothetical protein
VAYTPAGTYGVRAYIVAERRREIGIRKDRIVVGKMMKRIVLTLAALLFCNGAHAQVAVPERKVESTVVTSSDPAVRITLPREARYVGADRWTLYGVADCEVHVFVEAGAAKNVQRVYWVQFEAYIPSQPDSKYNYDRDSITEINGLAVHHRERFGADDEKPRAGSDLEHVRAMILAAGYTLPKEIINSRLVHLPDATKRKEVMVIYMEDMATTGKTVADFIVAGKISEAWTPVGEKLLERARRA